MPNVLGKAIEPRRLQDAGERRAAAGRRRNQRAIRIRVRSEAPRPRIAIERARDVRDARVAPPAVAEPETGANPSEPRRAVGGRAALVFERGTKHHYVHE